MRNYELANDGQPDPAARTCPRRPSRALIERVENTLCVSHSHAGPVIEAFDGEHRIFRLTKKRILPPAG